MKSPVIVLAGSAAALGLLLTAHLLRQPPVQDTQTTQSARPDGSGVGATIGVAGLWHVQILNADGSVAGERHFKNAFVGVNTVRSIFMNQRVFHDFSIALRSLGGLCTNTQNEASACTIRDAARAPFGGTDVFYNLVRTETGTGIRLQGSAIATNAGNLQFVDVLAAICLPTETAAECRANSEPAFGSANTGLFTSHQLTGPELIAVEAGQQVRVSVDIQFSSL